MAVLYSPLFYSAATGVSEIMFYPELVHILHVRPCSSHVEVPRSPWHEGIQMWLSFHRHTALDRSKYLLVVTLGVNGEI